MVSPSHSPPAVSPSKPHPYRRRGCPSVSAPTPAVSPSPPAAGAPIRRNSLTSSPSRDPGRAPPPAAAAAGPARECECECGCGCARCPAGSARVVCLWRVPCVCVSVSERVRADTATPASCRRASASAGPAAGRGPSAAGVRAEACRLSVRPRGPGTRSLHRPFCSEAPPPPLPTGSFHGHTHTHRHTPARRGQRLAPPLQLQCPERRRRWSRGPQSPGHWPGAFPGPAPLPSPAHPSGPQSSRGCLRRIQQLKTNLTWGGPREVRSAPQRPPEDIRAPWAQSPWVDPSNPC